MLEELPEEALVNETGPISTEFMFAEIEDAISSLIWCSEGEVKAMVYDVGMKLQSKFYPDLFLGVFSKLGK